MRGAEAGRELCGYHAGRNEEPYMGLESSENTGNSMENAVFKPFPAAPVCLTHTENLVWTYEGVAMEKWQALKI